MAKTIIFKEKIFLSNGGGAPNDSLRGFGPTSQYWKAPTSNGWMVSYDGNSADYAYLGVSPDDIRWINMRASSCRQYYVKEEDHEAFMDTFKRKQKAYKDYREKHTKLRHGRHDSRFPWYS